MNDNPTAFYTAEYDKKIKMTLPCYEEFYKQAADTVRHYCGDNPAWLDVGCGTGKMAQEALRAVKPERFVFCDACAGMIEICRGRFCAPYFAFTVSAVQELEYEKEFDVVTAIQVHHYLQKDERAAAIKKCWRALKPGGIFISYENFAPQGRVIEKLYRDRWQAWQLDQGGTQTDCQRHRERYGKEYFPVSLQEQLQLLKAAGFKEAEILWVSYMQAGFVAIT